MLEYLRSGDKLVVYKADRLARSTFDLQKIVKELKE
ncbi:recombinase family protein [Bacillus cereus group sp. N12]